MGNLIMIKVVPGLNILSKIETMKDNYMKKHRIFNVLLVLRQKT